MSILSFGNDPSNISKVEVEVTPDPFKSDPLPTGAHPTGAVMLTVPIPEGSDVKRFAVTFRDRREDFDDDSRTTSEITLSKEALLTNIATWTSSDVVFNGVSWRRHRKVFNMDRTTYEYSINAHFTGSELLLIFEDTHAGSSNRYGGWEGLVVNFTPTTKLRSTEEVEVEEILGTYIPTITEGRAVSLVTGISMEAPATHVRIQFTGASGYYEMLLNLDGTVQNLQGLPASSTTYHQTQAIPIRIELEDAATGTLRNNTNMSNAHSTVRRVDVFTRKRVKVLK